MIREKLTDTIVCVIRNTQPIKTDQLSRVLRMISEAVRGGGGVNKLPTRFTKEKIE